MVALRASERGVDASIAPGGWSEGVELRIPELGVVLVTRDVDAARDFYRDVLDFTEAGAGALRVGGHRVELREVPHAPRRAAGIYDAVGLRVLAVFVDDLDAVIARVRARGRRIADASWLPGRLRVTFAKDADGNLLELLGLPEPAGGGLVNRLQLGLTVRDIATSRRFYGEVLGLPEQPPIEIGDGHVRYTFHAGTTAIKFWSPGGALPVATGCPEDAVGIRELVFGVDDVDATCAELAARGVVLAVAPAATGGGGRTAVVTDPDGNWLRLTSGPSRVASSARCG